MEQYKFSEIAINITEKRKSNDSDRSNYIGLEHLESGNLYINKWGSRVPLKGEKLIMTKGDVLFGRRNTYLKRTAIAPFDGLFSAHGMVLRPREEVISKSFFPFFLSSDYFYDAAIRISVGSISPTINWGTLKDLTFTIPSIDDQKRLAPLLWAIIDTKNAYKNLLNQTEALVKSRFIEMFGDPVTNPKGWEIVKLKDLSTKNLSYGSTASSIPYNNIRYIRITDIMENGDLNDDIVSPSKYDEKYLLSDGDILFARSGATVGKTFMYNSKWGKSIYAGYLIRFIPNTSKILPVFIFEYTKTDYYSSFVKLNMQTVAQPNINAQLYGDLSVFLPPLTLQNQFAAFVEQADKSKFIALSTAKNLAFCRPVAIFSQFFHNRDGKNRKNGEIPMFNEANAIEEMVIHTLIRNGWTYRAPDELPRQTSDVMVEKYVKEALVRLNTEIQEDPSRADEVIYKLRALIQTVHPENLITQNELFKKLIFEENSYPFGKDGQMVPLRFFGTDAKEQQDLNSYVVTNQWVYPAEKGGKRLDIVLLVNGFPLAIGELKTPVRNAITWMDGAADIADYEQSIPQMFVTNVLNFATEGKFYRYGAVNMPLNMWGPWHDPDNKNEGSLTDVQRSVESMLKPGILMDIFQFFTIFATDKKHRKYKIITRYQQYEGANLIVERVKAGYPKKGLIWHFQGSGKSLLMVFAAQKLRMTPELKSPTVVIVDDRIDLETQITATFNASDIPNCVSAATKDELMNFFKVDTHKILITTIFKFGEVTGVLNDRSNIILMVDEAHRTQEGDLGEKMRLALPNAFFFGLTGTPINRIDKNTFYTFGALEDRSGYLSRYSFSDSIRDNATLPLHFETVPVELHVNQALVDELFNEMTKHLDETEKTELARRVRIEAIMKTPKRITAVCEHIAKHFREKIEPNGFKGQVVCYDRECCLLYKRELDRIMGENASTIVIDTNNDKADKYKPWRRDRDAEARILDNFRDKDNPLKLVIVTSKLLTGFDAPILQVMYLDKPMRDHTLLQAICRTNRLYGQEKTHGLIVDYIGIFDDVARSLNFDDQQVRQVVTNINEVKERFPMLMEKCLSYFEGLDRTVEGYEGLMAAQSRLPTNKEKDAFAADYTVLGRAWEALSPDIFLAVYKNDYLWLTDVYKSVKPLDDSGRLIWAALGAKTLELVHENINVIQVRDDPDVLKLDADLIDQFFESKKDVQRAAKKIEINLVARIQAHSNDPKYISLGQRLEELREKHEQGLIASIEFLKMLLQLAKEAAQAEKEVVPEDEIDKGIAALTELFNGIKNQNTPIIVERIVSDIDGVVKIVRFPGWQNTTAGRQEIGRALRKILYLKYKIKDDEVYNKAYNYLEQYY